MGWLCVCVRGGGGRGRMAAVRAATTDAGSGTVRDCAAAARTDNSVGRPRSLQFKPHVKL